LSSVSLNTSQVANFLNAYNNSVKPSQTPNNPKQLQDEQAELAPLTSDVLVSMRNFIMEEPLKESMNVDDMLSLVFSGDKSLSKLAKVFIDNNSTNDSKELILARFAMKFFFDKILDQNNPKMAEVVNILNNNNDLKEAVKQVLSELDDKSAINRFKEVFELKKVAIQEPVVAKAIDLPSVSSDISFKSGEVAPIISFSIYTATLNEEAEAQKCKVNADGTYSAACRVTANSNNELPKLKEAKGLFVRAAESASEFKHKKAQFDSSHEIFFNRAGVTEGSEDETTYKSEDSLRQVHRFGIRKGFVSGKMMEAVISFNPETGDIKVDRTNSHFQSVVAKVMKKHSLTLDAAEARVIGHIKESLCERELEKRSASLTKDEAKMNVLMSKANDKLQYINQQITFILEREQAILTLKETFKKIEVPITYIFGKDSTTAGRAMVAAMVKNNQQSKYNEGMQDTYLTGKILASFKALQEILQRVYVDPKVVDAVEGVLKLSSK
jgi:hypothetical protein